MSAHVVTYFSAKAAAMGVGAVLFPSGPSTKGYKLIGYSEGIQTTVFPGREWSELPVRATKPGVIVFCYWLQSSKSNGDWYTAAVPVVVENLRFVLKLGDMWAPAEGREGGFDHYGKTWAKINGKLYVHYEGKQSDSFGPFVGAARVSDPNLVISYLNGDVEEQAVLDAATKVEEQLSLAEQLRLLQEESLQDKGRLERLEYAVFRLWELVGEPAAEDSHTAIGLVHSAVESMQRDYRQQTAHLATARGIILKAITDARKVWRSKRVLAAALKHLATMNIFQPDSNS